MNSLVKIMLILFILFCNSCSLFSNQLELIPNSKVKINENDSCLITGIRAFEINPNEETFALIDKTGFNIQIYGTSDGKQLAFFQSSDSLNQPMIDKSDYWFDINLKDYLLIVNSLASRVGYDRKLIKNTFSTLSFINDSIMMIGGTMRALAIDTTNKKTVLANIGGLYLFNDTLKKLYSTAIESNNYEYSLLPYLYSFTDSTFLCTVSNYGTSNPDSMTFLSEFYPSGKHFKLIQKLPEDFVKSKLYYNAALNPCILKIGNKVIFASYLDYKIRDLFGDFSFEIKGFDTTNKYSFFNRVSSPKITITQDDKPVNKRYFYYYINKILNWSDKYIVVNLVNQKSILQFYTIDGKLISSYYMKTVEGLKIIDISKGKKSNTIYALAFDDEDYYLLTYKIE